MGFFKGMKDLKDLSDHHGGMPSIAGAFRDIGAMADDRGEREVLEAGTPAKAVVKGFPEPVPGDRFAMQIPLEVHPTGGAPYPLNYVFPSTRMKAGLMVGTEIPVKIHPSDPLRIAVQWDALKADIAATGGDMAAAMKGIQNAYGTAANEAYEAARSKTASDTPATRLKQLEDLKKAGLITDAEYAEKRAKIVGDL